VLKALDSFGQPARFVMEVALVEAQLGVERKLFQPLAAPIFRHMR